MENLQLVYPPQGMGNSQTQWVCLGLPEVIVAASSSNPGQLENVTTVLAMALSALRMDESWLVAGAIKLIFYLIVFLVTLPRLSLFAQ